MISEVFRNNNFNTIFKILFIYETNCSFKILMKILTFSFNIK